MKTSISLFAMAASALALFTFAGCIADHGMTSHVSQRNFALGSYHSTPGQIRVARDRAEKHYATISSARKKEMRENGVRYLAVRTLDPSPEQLAEIKNRAATSGGASFGYGGASISGPSTQAGSDHNTWHCVMIWDTYAKDLVGSDCYAVTTLPPQGQSVRFDTHVAEYIGEE